MDYTRQMVLTDGNFSSDEGTSVVQGKRAGMLVKRLSDRSCTRGMIHNKIHRVSPGCPPPSIGLQVEAYDTNHFNSNEKHANSTWCMWKSFGLLQCFMCVRTDFLQHVCTLNFALQLRNACYRELLTYLCGLLKRLGNSF